MILILLQTARVELVAVLAQPTFTWMRYDSMGFTAAIAVLGKLATTASERARAELPKRWLRNKRKREGKLLAL